jgi:phage shock protein E
MIMNKLLIFLLPIMVLTSCSAETDASNNKREPEHKQEVKVQSIGGDEMRVLLKETEDVVVLDVRTPKEYGSGHLKDAQHIDFYLPDFSKRLQALRKDKTYVMYCASGGRSQKAAQMMVQMGFEEIYNASTGFEALKKSGIPVD